MPFLLPPQVKEGSAPRPFQHKRLDLYPCNVYSRREVVILPDLLPALFCSCIDILWANPYEETQFSHLQIQQ